MDGGGGTRDIRTAADLTDEEALRNATLAQLVMVPDPLVLPLVSKLVKVKGTGATACISTCISSSPFCCRPGRTLDFSHRPLSQLLPASILRGTPLAGPAASTAADTDAANAATNRELQRIVAEMRIDDGENGREDGSEGGERKCHMGQEAT